MNQGLRALLPLTFVCAVCLIAVAPGSHGAIFGQQDLTVDLTDIADVTAKVTWAGGEGLAVTGEGLGWTGPGGQKSGWIQTKPVAIGLSWRPAHGVHLQVEIQPEPRETLVKEDRTWAPPAGDVYARYSPDRVHWSSWQALQQPCGASGPDGPKPGRFYSGYLRVPERERRAYGKLFSEYSTLDVPWTCDEEAGVKWILERDEDFFATNLPFIGYVEILYEGEFHAGQPLTLFQVTLSWGVGGIHSLPKDPAVKDEREGSPWRFVGEQKEGSGVAGAGSE